MAAKKPDSSPSPTQTFIQLLSSARTIFINFIFFIAVIAICALVYRSVNQNHIIIENIETPPILASNGYTKEVASYTLLDKLNEINKGAATTKLQLNWGLDDQKTDISIPDTGLSLSSMSQIIRTFLDIKETRISGEFACIKHPCNISDLYLKIRLTDGNNKKHIPMAPLKKRSFDTYFQAAAIKIMHWKDPYLIASYYFNTENYEAAERVLRQMIRSGSAGENWALNLMGLVQHKLGKKLDNQERHDYAITVFRHAMQKYPEFTYSHINLANTLQALGQYDAAIAEYKRAAEDIKNRAPALFGWGTAHYRKEEYKRAALKFRIVAYMDPNRADIWHNWGLSLLKVGETELAIEKFKRATNLDTGHKSARMELASIFSATGKINEAIIEYKLVLLLYPECTIAREKLDQLLNNKFEERK